MESALQQRSTEVYRIVVLISQNLRFAALCFYRLFEKLPIESRLNVDDQNNGDVQYFEYSLANPGRNFKQIIFN